MREILDRLVSFDTVSHRSNKELIEFVGAYLASHGIDPHVMESGDGRKANLFATIGENRTGGVALSGHTDVVPVEGQTWGTDPFRVHAADGRLYGRGTCDMKGFIAAVLAAVPKFCGRRLSVPIHILLSYDEEIGCVGVRPMIEAIGRNLPMPEIVIVGEPTNMRVVHAHKGFSGFRTTITGQAAHSSLPHLGASAILIANRLIAGLAEIVAGVRARTAPDSPFFPPDTTFNIGRIAGGNAVNIIPESCVIEWECRPVARGDMTEITERFEKLCREIQAAEAARIEGVTIRTEVTADVPPCEPQENSAAEALVKHLLGTNRSEAVSFGTEAALFQEKGMSVVICGPGNMDQAHQPNEFVAEEQLEQCEAFLGKLLDWAAPGD